MSDMVNIQELSNTEVCVIDMETGTVLGTNLALAYVPSDRLDEILDSDDAAFNFAVEYGQPLYVDMSEAGSL